MSILVDTSIWIDHLRRSDRLLAARLAVGEVVCHPFVVGELACGSLKSRKQILDYLTRLVQLPISAHDEVLHLIDKRRLMGRGLGWIDVHLLSSALVTRNRLWTRDRALGNEAASLGIAV